MDRESYRFVIRCLGWSIFLIVVASIFLGTVKYDAGQLVPVLVPVTTLLGGLLVTPPK